MFDTKTDPKILIGEVNKKIERNTSNIFKAFHWYGKY